DVGGAENPIKRKAYLDRTSMREALEAQGAQVMHGPPSSTKRILYILHAEAEVSPRLGTLPTYIWTSGDFSLVPEGCASSLGRRLVDLEPGRSPCAGVDFWSLVELQPLGVHYNVSRGVAYLWSGNNECILSLPS
ncbi:hypothetical protein B296_00057136, partial [Ensete ventricosum]